MKNLALIAVLLGAAFLHGCGGSHSSSGNDATSSSQSSSGGGSSSSSISSSSSQSSASSESSSSTSSTSSSTSSLNPNGVTVLSSTHKPVLVGVVIDSAVSNLKYDLVSIAGVTDAQGRFAYLPGELIYFKVGDVALPPIVGRPIVTPLSFSGSEVLRDTDLLAINVARFLQSLDTDGNPDNGIAISAQAHAAATGKSLNFTSASFDADANAILAVAGGVNTTLISADAAKAHLRAALNALPKANPAVGAWVTGSGTSTRALVLLENGWYYGIEANCNGTPDYEFGSYSYSASQITFTVSEDHDGSCGLNSGPMPVSVNGTAMTLAGQSWSDVTDVGGIAGLYLFDDLLTAPSLGGFSLTMLTNATAGQYINFNTACSFSPAIEIGTYSYIDGGPYMDPSHGNSIVAPDSGLMTLVPIADNSASCGPSSWAQSGPLQVNVLVDWHSRLGLSSQFVTSLNSWGIKMLPDRFGGSIVGSWVVPTIDTGLQGRFTFTHDGRYLEASADATNCGSDTYGETGVYAWDSVTGQVAINVQSDSDSDCGAADLANGQSASAIYIGVTGNLLTWTTPDGSGVAYRQSVYGPDVFDGTWSLEPLSTGPVSTFWSSSYKDYTSNVILEGLDTNCARSTLSYTVQDVDYSISTSALTNTAPTSCGLPALNGAAFSRYGDQLTIAGLGQYVLER